MTALSQLPVPAPQPEPLTPRNPEEQTLAMLSHLLGILTGFLGPLIIWLVKREQSAFLDHHGKESLNFQLTIILASVCFVAVAVVVAMVTFGLGMFLIAPLWLAAMIFALVWEIQACMAANSGQPYRYPFCIRFIA